MGEASQRRKSKRALLKDNPFCIFCGGTEPATTTEHCPPRMMFRGKQRPHDLVFSSCEICNLGTKRSDLVASLLGRVYTLASSSGKLISRSKPESRRGV